ncbi:Ldh family oxidoreductase [Aestuariivirga sp.]|uniref:Ldh family oxidoreductase n=1 Tax=Aestuariivirga sp. TaxID=2650926 RepID=UPI0039E46229
MTRSAFVSQLFDLSMAMLKAVGTDKPSAEATSYAMLHASLHGVESHGIRLLPFYADSVRTGLAVGKPDIRVSHPRRAVALVDAGNSLGHIATYRAMDEACGIARECGIGMAAVIHSTHFGAAGAYALAAADAGFIGFITANSGSFVIPHGGTKPMHGTSPIAMAAPNPKGDPFLLDMATSSIPWNKVLRYRTEGIVLPEGVAVDEQGKFVTDPFKARALAPVGGANFGYKGAGLAGIAEVLGGVLTGMRLSIEQDGRALGDSEMGHFVMAIDPTLFMSMEQFGERLNTYIEAFKAQPGTYAAGGPEWEKRRDREANGIPLPDGLYAELKAAAQKAGVPFEI